jgi:hypothetical protein
MSKLRRKRRDGRRREPNGRLSRRKADREANARMADNETSVEAMATVLAARWRVHGITAEHAKDPLAGSAVGRLCLSDQISRDQYDAAIRYLDVLGSYEKALLLRTGKPSESKGSPHGLGDSPEYIDWCQAQIERWDEVTTLLTELMYSLRSPGPRAALDVVVVRDVDMPELAADLRLALNALARHFSIGRGAKAA